jgi:hypothetical protein
MVVILIPPPSSLLPNAAEAKEKGEAQGRPILTNPGFTATKCRRGKRKKERLRVIPLSPTLPLLLPLGARKEERGKIYVSLQLKASSFYPYHLVPCLVYATCWPKSVCIARS